MFSAKLSLAGLVSSAILIGAPAFGQPKALQKIGKAEGQVDIVA